MSKSREEFENFLCSTYYWPEDVLSSATFQGTDEDGCYTGKCDDKLFWAWIGWQAAKNHKVKND